MENNEHEKVENEDFFNLTTCINSGGKKNKNRKWKEEHIKRNKQEIEKVKTWEIINDLWEMLF